MGYMQDGLSFNTLREANMKRLPLFKNSKGEYCHTKEDGSDWSVSDWVECVTGELGEFANLHKKYRRGDVDYDTFIKEGAKELADIQIYLDILALQLKLNLGQITKEKFNEVSEKIGCPIYIGDDGDWHMKNTNPLM